MSRFVLSTIKLGKRFFYNTPIHRLKVTTTIYRKLFQLAYKPGEIVNVRYEGSDFQVPSNDITILPSMLTDNYEKLELAVLREILKPGMTFVDVGANIGIHTVTAAKAVGDAGCVFGFEPEPNNFRMLTENTRRNACTNVVLENAAVGEQASRLALFLATGSIGTHSLVQSGPAADASTIEVDVVSLDEYFATKEQSVDVLKIDVEGYEPSVLKGAQKLLAGVSALMFEYSQKPVADTCGIAGLIKLLAPFPHLYVMDERTHQIRPFAPDDFYRSQYDNVLATKVPYSR